MGEGTGVGGRGDTSAVGLLPRSSLEPARARGWFRSRKVSGSPPIKLSFNSRDTLRLWTCGIISSDVNMCLALEQNVMSIHGRAVPTSAAALSTTCPRLEQALDGGQAGPGCSLNPVRCMSKVC